MNKDLLKTSRDLFPELIDNTDVNRFIDLINIDDLREAVYKALEHADYTIKDEYENKVAEVLLDALIKKNLLSANNRPYYIDTLLSACFLHNIYYDEQHKPTSLMKAREEFDYIYDEYNIPEDVREMIWDAIESQCGDFTPMLKTKPAPNSPQDLFATCVWVVKSNNRWFLNK